MNIKEYLKYYIGQKCLNMWLFEGHEQNKWKWTLVAVDLLAKEPYRLRYRKEITWSGEIKPLLRKLSSMTEDEVAGLATVYGLKDFVLTKGNCEGSFIQMEYLQKGASQTDFIHWYIHQLNAPMFHYLLSRGFDLFSLIENNLAIDADTLKEQV